MIAIKQSHRNILYNLILCWEKDQQTNSTWSYVPIIVYIILHYTYPPVFCFGLFSYFLLAGLGIKSSAVTKSNGDVPADTREWQIRIEDIWSYNNQALFIWSIFLFKYFIANIPLLVSCPGAREDRGGVRVVASGGGLGVPVSGWINKWSVDRSWGELAGLINIFLNTFCQFNRIIIMFKNTSITRFQFHPQILTPRIRYSSCSCSVTEKTG